MCQSQPPINVSTHRLRVASRHQDCPLDFSAQELTESETSTVSSCTTKAANYMELQSPANMNTSDRNCRKVQNHLCIAPTVRFGVRMQIPYEGHQNASTLHCHTD